MNEEQLKQILEDTYDEPREATMRSWITDCYSKRMRWVMICVNGTYLVLSVLGILSAIAFFKTDQAKYQIMYAAIFVCCNLWIGFGSVFGWVMMQRPSISREIKRLELRVAELGGAAKGK